MAQFKFVPFLVTILVILGITEGITWRKCSNCVCFRYECDFPKTPEECQRCADVGTETRKSSFEDDHCWVKIGDASEGDCALRSYGGLVGCSGFNGFTHYTVGNICWATWRSPEEYPSTNVTYARKLGSIGEREFTSVNIDDSLKFHNTL